MAAQWYIAPTSWMVCKELSPENVGTIQTGFNFWWVSEVDSRSFVQNYFVSNILAFQYAHVLGTRLQRLVSD